MMVQTLLRGRRALAMIAAVVLSIAVALVPSGAQSSAPPPRRVGIAPMKGFFQADTFLHLFGGVMAGMFAASAAAALNSQSTVQRYPLYLPAVGFSAALAAGIAKETLDSTGFGDPQWTDLLHTMIGGLVVAGMIAAVELAPSSGTVRSQSAVFAAAGVAVAIPIGAAFAEEIHHYLVRRRRAK